jgi:hypothetical protein
LLEAVISGVDLAHVECRASWLGPDCFISISDGETLKIPSTRRRQKYYSLDFFSVHNGLLSQRVGKPITEWKSMKMAVDFQNHEFWAAIFSLDTTGNLSRVELSLKFHGMGHCPTCDDL